MHCWCIPPSQKQQPLNLGWSHLLFTQTPGKTGTASGLALHTHSGAGDPLPDFQCLQRNILAFPESYAFITDKANQTNFTVKGYNRDWQR